MTIFMCSGWTTLCTWLGTRGVMPRTVWWYWRRE